MQQTDWRTALQFAGVGVVIVIVIRLAGFIENIWTGIGILAIGHAFVAVTYLPSWRKTAKWVIVLWVLITVVRPIIWNSLSPQVQDAISSRRVEEETRTSETLRGHGADVMRTLAAYCSEMEARYTAEVENLRQKLISLDLGNVHRPRGEAALKQATSDLIAWRRECTKSLQHDSASVKGFISDFKDAVLTALHPDNSKEWYDLLGILLLGGYGLFITKWKGPWTRSIGGTMLLAFLFFSGRYALFETKLYDWIDGLDGFKVGEGPIIPAHDPMCTVQVKMDEENPSWRYNAVSAMGGRTYCKTVIFHLWHGGKLNFDGDPCTKHPDGGRVVVGYGGGGDIAIYNSSGEFSKKFIGTVTGGFPFQMDGTGGDPGIVTVTCD